MIEVKRKQNESISSFMRRFSRRVIQSGLITRVRKRAFFKKALNKREKRLSAIYRANKIIADEKQRKMGKVVNRK